VKRRFVKQSKIVFVCWFSSQARRAIRNGAGSGFRRSFSDAVTFRANRVPISAMRVRHGIRD
jgi:hypothetical protein